MSRLSRTLFAGAAAGAAGTTALNAVTYLDMTVRGRPSSSAPEDTVERLVETAGVSIPGHGDTRDNRLAGLGALTGLATGAGVGAVGGLLLRRTGLSRRGLGLALGAAAMAGSNVPMTALKVTDPKTWSATDWIADVGPHLAYGAVTAMVYEALVD